MLNRACHGTKHPVASSAIDKEIPRAGVLAKRARLNPLEMRDVFSPVKREPGQGMWKGFQDLS